MVFEWDKYKNRLNKIKHGISFETALLVFNDPFLMSVPDHDFQEERWKSIGLIETIAIFVAHTVSEITHDHEEIIRIISARAATTHEKQQYYSYRGHRQRTSIN